MPTHICPRCKSPIILYAARMIEEDIRMEFSEYLGEWIETHFEDRVETGITIDAMKCSNEECNEEFFQDAYISLIDTGDGDSNDS